jgi:uncharacterized protein (TIGR02266 family)
MGHERRRHPRLAIAIAVDFSSADNFYTAKTRDISLGGLFINTEIGMPIGSEITVQLELLGVPHSVACEVVWTLVDHQDRPCGLGLRFLELPGPTKVAIERFMTLRGPMNFEVTADSVEPELPDPDPARPPPPPKPKPRR